MSTKRNTKKEVKKEIKKDTKVSKTELAKKARAKRMAMAGVTVKQVEENSREEFRKYFVQLSRKIGLKKEMENVIWSHFKSTGHDVKDKFDAGIKHFGYKL